MAILAVEQSELSASSQRTPGLASTPVFSLRPDGRRPDQLRPLRFQNHVAPYAAGSTLIEWGNTRVICAATIEDLVPRWMKEQGVPGGWVTAEYSMLPYSTLQRKPREVSRGKVEGRTQEIQRLIGRALRAIVDLTKLGSRTIWLDCDVLQADGGTRTAAITGSFVALRLAVAQLVTKAIIPADPIRSAVAAVSVGVVNGQILTDLCYIEDSTAQVDLNLVMTSEGKFVELQGTGEKATFSETELTAMLAQGRRALQELFQAQAQVLELARV